MTLKNLGLAERSEDRAALTDAGVGFAAKIGTAMEEGAFRDVLLDNVSFGWFWQRASSSGKTTGRRDLLQLAATLYPNYREQTRKTLVGVYLNYAKHAGLVRRGPGGSRYAIAHRSLPKIALGALLDTQDQATKVEAHAEKQVDAGQDPLMEVGTMLGGALADDTLFGSDDLRARTLSGFSNASRLRVNRPDVTLVRLAQQLSEAAFQRRDTELLRAAIRLVHWILTNSASYSGATPRA